MRDNGLPASSYVAIADLDPTVADAMLAILREARVAAYTEPCPPPLAACLEVRLPAIPCDRLYVDETAEALARSLLDDHLPQLREARSETARSDPPQPDASQPGTSGSGTPASGTGTASAGTVADRGDESHQDAHVPRSPGDDHGDDHRPDHSGLPTVDEERAWAQIVAGYDVTTDDVVPRWPAQEDLDPQDRSGDDSDATTSAADRASSDVDDLLAADHPADGSADANDTKAAADPDDHFVPPPPPPLPRIDPLTKVAWVAVLGGPALLLAATVAGPYVPSWFVPVGVVAFICGFLALVVRMQGGPPDGDDGAIV